MGVQGLWALEGEATLSPCSLEQREMVTVLPLSHPPVPLHLGPLPYLGGWLAVPGTGPLGTAHLTAWPTHEVDEGAGWAGPAWLERKVQQG